MGLQTAAAVVLGLVFTWSGANKLVSKSWPNEAREFGAPPWSIQPLPIIELALGAGLAASQARWIGWMLVGLIVAFTARLVAHLRAGRRPHCACFGGFTKRALSWWSVARNAALLVCGLLAALA